MTMTPPAAKAEIVVGATSSSSTAAANGAANDSRSKATTARDVQARRPPELPLHLTEKILCCIDPLPSARLATVCKSWAATVAGRLARPVPHLFVYLPADNKSDRRGRVVSVPVGYGVAGGGAAGAPHPVPAVVPNRVLLADTNGLACIGAMPGGHLAFASWWSKFLVLINPITGARQSVQVEEPRRGLVLAAGAGDHDAFVSVGTDEHVLWRRPAGGGAGEEWSRWTVPATAAAHGIVSAAVSGSCFYLLDDGGHVSVVDVAAPPPLRMEKLAVASLLDGDVASRAAASLNVNHPAAKGHLLESDGEVLFVRPVIACTDAGGGGATAAAFCNHAAAVFLAVLGFEVNRLDTKGGRWARVEKLPGDRAIFVSAGSSFVVRSSETAAAGGCRSNCVYFVGNRWYCSACNRDAGKAWGVYSMEDPEVLFEHAVTEPGPCSAATWFLPRVVQGHR